ncbi:MAG: hypothetical protein D6793_03205 [Thermoflexia bacterium]|nr:MAG: hypothetical protein D6793_03205 [Thermoflexia bacterium]
MPDDDVGPTAPVAGEPLQFYQDADFLLKGELGPFPAGLFCLLEPFLPGENPVAEDDFWIISIRAR